ncbi:MAG: hypothetical protein Ct9H300mP12_04080 [Acidimicrobiales bacterium]|nr:MAG: hypothetical protein Ct9H300mP12_04080 [Acidimicrobiales bacterium]
MGIAGRGVDLHPIKPSPNSSVKRAKRSAGAMRPPESKAEDAHPVAVTSSNSVPNDLQVSVGQAHRPAATGTKGQWQARLAEYRSQHPFVNHHPERKSPVKHMPTAPTPGPPQRPCSKAANALASR